MVTTGFSKPYVAKYSNTGTAVTYTGGMDLGRGVNLSLEIDTADDNNFYADNIVAETESSQFTSGSATITVDGLSNDAATMIFGLPAPENVDVGEEQVPMQGYGELNAPYVGYGCVRRTQENGVVKFWPLILPKIKFNVPSEEMATAEDQIDWQTQELTATVLRDDTTAKRWKRISTEGMDTEDEAYEVVKAILGGGEAMRTLEAKTGLQAAKTTAAKKEE